MVGSSNWEAGVVARCVMRQMMLIVSLLCASVALRLSARERARAFLHTCLGYRARTPGVEVIWRTFERASDVARARALRT